MTEQLINFFHMGGHGFYIWTSYTAAIVFLGIQWFIPWRRWRRYQHEQKNKHE